MRTWACLIIILSLAGCSAPEGSQRERFVPARPVTSIVAGTVTGTVKGAWAAVQTPFEDLNIKRQKIPEKLQRIVSNPYVFPIPLRCSDLRKEIAELDMLLGPDVCTQENPTGSPVTPPEPLPWQAFDVCTPDNPTGAPVSRRGEYVEKGAGFAREHVVGMVSSKANILPFRGVVRKVTGAEKHAKEVERAYQAGKLRRAFLKGLMASLGPECLNQPTPLLPADQPPVTH